MKKYEAPRAVRLSDAATGAFACVDGPLYLDQCQSGEFVGWSLCESGSAAM